MERKVLCFVTHAWFATSTAVAMVSQIQKKSQGKLDLGT